MNVKQTNPKGDAMAKFIIEETDEKLTPNSGLDIVGQLLSNTALSTRLDQLLIPNVKTMPDVSNSDVAKSYIGLLCQGKSDFECIEEYREDPFYQYALDIGSVPSCSTLRQRLDDVASPDTDASSCNRSYWKSRQSLFKRMFTC